MSYESFRVQESGLASTQDSKLEPELARFAGKDPGANGNALGLNPNLPCTSYTDGANPGLPLLGTEGPVLTLTYQRDTAKTDITYVIETSTDLMSWSSSGVTEQILSTNGTVQTVKASVTVKPKVFMRLRVTE